MPSRTGLINRMGLSAAAPAPRAGVRPSPSTPATPAPPRPTPEVLDRLTAHLRIVRMPQLRGLQWRGPTLPAALLCALVPIVWGQEAVIRGRVSDDRGEVLATAAVEVVELGLAAYSCSDGRYAITIPAPRVSGQLVTLRAPLIGHKAAMRRITLSPREQ